MIRKLAAIIVLLVMAVAAWGAWDLYHPYRGFGAPEKVEIAPGTGVPAIAELLVSRGVLAHRWPFVVRYWLARRRRSLKAGEYYFDRPLRPLDVYRKLAAGDVYLYTVVIPEGSDRFDIARVLAERLAIDPDTFLSHTRQTLLIHDLDPIGAFAGGLSLPGHLSIPQADHG